MQIQHKMRLWQICNSLLIFPQELITEPQTQTKNTHTHLDSGESIHPLSGHQASADRCQTSGAALCRDEPGHGSLLQGSGVAPSVAHTSLHNKLLPGFMGGEGIGWGLPLELLQ